MMTPQDHVKMKNYLLSSENESVKNGLARNFTYSNVCALLIWLLYAVVYERMDIFLWLKIFATSASVFFSGWMADRLWYRYVSERFDKPFSLKAYASRLPFFFVLSGIFFIMALFFNRLITIIEMPLYFALGGTLQCVIQIPLQWSLFNRLRKLSLTTL